MAELIAYLVKAMVDHPDQVQVREVPGDRVTVIELSVAEEDMGKVIGRQGRMVGALRTILKAAAIKAGTRAVLELV
jgi:predicted RNA-binding protein YlqC (UPF0109 family)